MAALRTRIADSAAQMESLEPLWTRLLRRQPHTLFQRYSWNRLAAEMFSDRLTPHIVCVESSTGAAIIPAAINAVGDQVELLGETLFDYRDVLHTGDPDVLHRAWRLLAAHLKPLRVTAITGTASSCRWGDFPLTTFARAPVVVRSEAGEESFRRSHSRLGRQGRRLRNHGVEFGTFTGRNCDLVRRVYESKRRQIAVPGQDNLFLDSRRCEFMIAAASMEGDNCRVYSMEKQGHLVAALVTFIDGDTRRFYTTYFDPDWAHYSPGQTLLYEATARSLGEGFDCDYMTGEYPYKLRLANASHALFRVDVGAEHLAGMAPRSAAESAA